MQTVAPEFPDVYFAQIGGGTGGSSPNLTSGELRTGELGHIMGILAGELTETNKIGFIGAMEIPTIVDDVAFINAAVKTYYPDVEVSIAYTGSWVDIAAGKEAAKAMISEGADVLIGIGDACDAGAIQACEESSDNVWFIGWSGDMSVLSPEKVATSAVQSIPTLVDIFAQQLINEEAGSAGVYCVKEGVLQMGTWAPGVPEEVKEMVISEYDKYITGEYTRSSVMEMIDAESEVVFD
jgi:basic membrane protein A